MRKPISKAKGWALSLTRAFLSGAIPYLAVFSGGTQGIEATAVKSLIVGAGVAGAAAVLKYVQEELLKVK